LITLSVGDAIIENVLFYKKIGTILNVFAIIDFIHATGVINYVSTIAWIYPRDFPRFSDGGSKDFQTRCQRESRQNESPGNRIVLNFNRIRPTRSVSVNKCSISCSLNVRFLMAKRTKRWNFPLRNIW